jgi:hypothetical protein
MAGYRASDCACRNGQSRCARGNLSSRRHAPKRVSGIRKRRPFYSRRILFGANCRHGRLARAYRDAESTKSARAGSRFHDLERITRESRSSAVRASAIRSIPRSRWARKCWASASLFDVSTPSTRARKLLMATSSSERCPAKVFHSIRIAASPALGAEGCDESLNDAA